MFDMLKNLTKATIAVAVTPITATVDMVTMPVDALDGEFAHRTRKKLDQAGRALDAALASENDKQGGAA